ncbi:MAG: biotin/lipoyl-binding protein [Deltaproteobacteria bacterium]|nr:biotin/lipoyl-binding protein [Deltaproteobacteria bacterium]
MARYRLNIADKTFEVEILSTVGGLARVMVNGRPYEVRFQALEPAAAAPATAARAPRPAPPAPEPPRPPAPAPRPQDTEAPLPGGAAVTAPMPGTVLEVLVQVGDQVKAGATVVKLEAMKMENAIPSPASGVVAEVRAVKGANVTKGEILLVVSQG